MANIAFQRLQREFREVVTSEEAKSTGIQLKALDDQLTKLTGEIRGPPETPYEGGVFTLDISIGDNYPFKPPLVKFVTRIWHPNVSSATGAICLDILKDQWAASMTLRTVLISVQALLADPQPKDPQDAIVARQCLTEMEVFRATARTWAQTYAQAPGPLIDAHAQAITRLTDMGVQRDEALTALSSCCWDLAKATERIFS